MINILRFNVIEKYEVVLDQLIVKCEIKKHSQSLLLVHWHFHRIQGTNQFEEFPLLQRYKSNSFHSLLLESVICIKKALTIILFLPLKAVFLKKKTPLIFLFPVLQGWFMSLIRFCSKMNGLLL